MHNAPYLHFGLAVQDLDAAMREVGAALGLSWAKVQRMTIAGNPVRFTYSLEGPPHVELLQGEPGGPWDATDGPHMHHVGYMSTDIASDRARLEAAGLELALASLAFTYRSSGSGMRVELVPEEARPAYERWFAGGDFA